MFELKEYQNNTLRVLAEYLEQARLRGPREAFGRTVARHPSDYRPSAYHIRWNLDEVPYICLRLPTGGGKTLLAAHSVSIAAHAFLGREHPFVLWLVPTNTIREQTVQALRKADHPYRQALTDAFGLQGVAVFDSEDINNIRPSDIFEKTCIVVSTMQTFRVSESNKDVRKIYGHNENFEQHFLRLPNAADGLDREDGHVLYSFVNMVHQLNPLVIVDEAHKMVSELSGEMMRRLNPACVIEFSATPVESNVLYRVFPSQLKAEEMVKLPFNLVEHVNWQEAVLRAVETRNTLAELASRDESYIRPIVLFQAEKKNQACTVDVLKNFLVNNGIVETELAVATGNQRELDNIDIFSRDCAIKYIITVEALKEGWDCSFAYVFCSVANIRSSIDVEQLLGRVMRMPYAKARREPKLNMAYAHVVAHSFSEAAQDMYNHMLNMGFDGDEAVENIRQTWQMLPGMAGNGNDFYANSPFGQAFPRNGETRDTAPTFELTLKKAPDFSGLDEASVGIEITKTDAGFHISSTGMISREAEEAIVGAAPAKQQEEIRARICFHRRAVAEQRPLSAARRGERFSVPLLLVEIDGEMEIADPEIMVGEWSPLDFLNAGDAPLTREEFQFDGTDHAFQFDLEGERLAYRPLDSLEQLTLFAVDEKQDAASLSRKLDRLCQEDDVSQPVMLEFCRRCVQGLVERDGVELTTLFRAKDVLAQCIRAKIKKLRERARQRGFQQLLFAPTAKVEVTFDVVLNFPLTGYAEGYPAYAGAYRFTRHYYDLPRDLKADGEEFRCAQAIDACPKVKTWIRNVDRQPGSFHLPTSTDRFYPDFVVQLHDGRILLVEYKGKHLVSGDDTKEKCNIGKLWTEKSHGKGLFMLVCENIPELTFERQMRELIG